jgi:hypothetical protein
MKELRKRLLEEIAARLKSEGYRKSQQTFARDFPGGRWLFHVAFIPHADDFDVTTDVAIRHDSIQQASSFGDVGRSFAGTTLDREGMKGAGQAGCL